MGDSRDKEVLKMLGVGEFDCAVVAIGDDLAASVLVTMNLKELGVPYIICKAHDDTHRRVLEKLGVTHLFSLDILSYAVTAVGTVVGSVLLSVAFQMSLKWAKKQYNNKKAKNEEMNHGKKA